MKSQMANDFVHGRNSWTSIQGGGYMKINFYHQHVMVYNVSERRFRL